MDRPLAPSDFWAKLKYKDGDRSTGEIVDWHPLLAHSADVAAVTEGPTDGSLSLFDGGVPFEFCDRHVQYHRLGMAAMDIQLLNS